MSTQKIALAVTSHPSMPTCDTLRAQNLANHKPRKDYVALSQILDADVIDYHFIMQQGASFSRFLARYVDVALAQAYEIWHRRHQYTHVLAWSDRIGIFAALLLKYTSPTKPLLSMVSTWATRSKKAFFFKYLHIHTRIKQICVRKMQAQLMHDALGIPTALLKQEPRGVDENFWQPLPIEEEPLIVAVGWEERDYHTLLEAIQSIPAEVVLVIGAIAKPLQGKGSEDVQSTRAKLSSELPSHVKIKHLQPHDLRLLYARASVVVIPVHPVEFDAGVTACTEAMAMGKAVIASHTAALSDLFEHEVHGMFVPPKDVQTLKNTIIQLLSNRELRQSLGQQARLLVEKNHSLEYCMMRLAQMLSKP